MVMITFHSVEVVGRGVAFTGRVIIVEQPSREVVQSQLLSAGCDRVCYRLQGQLRDLPGW
ncbi:MAG TPA: hypothetical protein DCP03_09495 [Polaromonas sp.]|nr:hypothetical protein [Polaromonas sp.]